MAPEKRNKLAFLALGTTVAISLYWALVIRIQQEWLVDNRALVEQTRQKLAINKVNAGKLPMFRADLEAHRRSLDTNEVNMASGDVYRWLINTFESLQKTNGTITLDAEPPRLGDVTILPKLPYQEATFMLSGKAYYHDLGNFLAKLENDFPHMRLRRLEIEPAHTGEPTGEEAEKLLFKMEVSTLVKPESSKP